MSIEVTSNFKTNEPTLADKAVLAGGDKKSDESKQSVSVNTDETNEESDASEITKISDDESLDADESENDESVEGEKPKKNWVKKRIGKLTAKISAKDQEIEYWKEQALKGKTPEKPLPESPKETKAQSNGKPDPNDFDTNAEYIEAITDWKLELKEQKAKEEKQVEQVKTTYQKQNEAHLERVNEFKKQTPDFDDVIGEFLDEHGDVKFSPAIEELVLTSNLSGAIVYEFAKNKKELDRLNSLSPMAAAREFGKLELKLSKETDSNKTVEVKTSKAPAPINPVGSKSSAASRKTIYDSDLSQSDYEAMRRAEMKARRA